jgi:Zn ribbon nucleic-acid-binding protein
MHISMRDIRARCPSCRSTDFEPYMQQPGEALSVVSCARCGRKMFHRQLVMQVSEAAVRKFQEELRATDDRDNPGGKSG